MQNSIFIKGARENNLKNIDVEIPRDKLVVITGLSGSGKSSLAFDTIYAEGQRRYVESLSSYARMFLGQMDKPDVDYIDGLSPAISIDQIVDRIMELPSGTRLQLLSPVIRGKKGEHAKVLEDARRSGYVRARVDGIAYDLAEEIQLEKNKKHDIEIVVDRLVLKPEIVRRLTEAFLLQQSPRRLPDLHGPGRAPAGGPGAHHAEPQSLDHGRRNCGLRLEQHPRRHHLPHVL